MSINADTRPSLHLDLGADGNIVFQGPRNSHFERRARLLGGRFDSKTGRWTFPRANAFEGIPAVIRTAIATSYSATAVEPLFDPGSAFSSWSEAFDEAVECGYLDQVLHPAHAVY